MKHFHEGQISTTFVSIPTSKREKCERVEVVSVCKMVPFQIDRDPRFNFFISSISTLSGLSYSLVASLLLAGIGSCEKFFEDENCHLLVSSYNPKTDTLSMYNTVEHIGSEAGFINVFFFKPFGMDLNAIRSSVVVMSSPEGMNALLTLQVVVNQYASALLVDTDDNSSIPRSLAKLVSELDRELSVLVSSSRFQSNDEGVFSNINSLTDEVEFWDCFKGRKGIESVASQIRDHFQEVKDAMTLINNSHKEVPFAEVEKCTDHALYKIFYATDDSGRLIYSVEVCSLLVVLYAQPYLMLLF